MTFSILRRVVIRSIYYSESCFCGCSYLVRRNASSTGSAHRFFWLQSRSKPISGGNEENVKTVLKEYGFDDSHLSIMARRTPVIFAFSAKNNIQPKLEFFNSIGISRSDLPNFVLNWAVLLASNLENQMIPCYEYLRSLSIQEEHFIKMLKCRPGILVTNVKTCISPNVELLKGLGVPMSSIASLVLRCAPTICRKHTTFKNFVDQLATMGMNPLLKIFIVALHVRCSISENTWERKVKLFKSFGLSEDDFILAFRKQPIIMALSEKKLTKTLGFFRNELCLGPDNVVRCPAILTLSFGRRIMPRCRVMDVLLKKGVVKKLACSSFLLMKEEMFLIKFIYRFKDDLPELMDIYSMDKCSQSKSDHLIHSD